MKSRESIEEPDQEACVDAKCLKEKCELLTGWYCAKFIAGVFFIILGLYAINQVAWKEHISRHSEDISGCSCQYALGGGAVAPGGSYPQIQTTSVTCASELHKYLVRQYDKDVETAVASARSYFDSYPRQPNASQIIVLDIDETALSNRAEWLNILDILKTGVNVPVKDHTLVGDSMAPALQPMLDLYTDLYRKGFSVTFITGRRDYALGRAATVKNLEAVGYGVACADAPAEGQRAERATRAPCYVALGMRGKGDQRLASVYKPDQRAQLQDEGYEIVASFGDQWSDLAGTSAAVASFKMPNPFYYIL